MWLRQRAYYFAILGIGGFFIGRGTEVMWPDLSAWTWWGMGAATFIIGFGTPPVLRRLEIPFRELAPPITAGALVLTLLGWLVYYALFVFEPMKTVWTHPTLSAAEQERTKAECEMRAYDAIGGGDLGAAPLARGQYTDACLTSKGFVPKKVKR